MKTKFLVITILFLNTALQFLMGYWWLIAIICFTCCWLWGQNAKQSILAACLGIGISWLGISLYQDWQAEFIISQTMSDVIGLGKTNLPFYIITLCIGLMVSSLSGYAGFVGKKFFLSTKSK